MKTVAEYSTCKVVSSLPYVLEVVLCRPNKLNAMNPAFFSELRLCFQAVAKAEARVVLLHAEGKHFTAGLDLSEFGSALPMEETDPARKSLAIHGLIKDWQDSFNSLVDCRVPVIGLIHGACIGGGMDLLGCFDVVLAQKDAYFSVKEIDIGIAADLGSLQRLPLLANNQLRLNELIYTGENFSAKEAKELGLISRVLESKEKLLQAGRRLAQVVASKSPVAILAIKQTLKAKEGRVREELQQMARRNSLMIQAPDMLQAIQAYFQKTQPDFAKL